MQMPRPEQSETLKQVGIILQSRPEDKTKIYTVVILNSFPTPTGLQTCIHEPISIVV